MLQISSRNRSTLLTLAFVFRMFNPFSFLFNPADFASTRAVLCAPLFSNSCTDIVLIAADPEMVMLDAWWGRFCLPPNRILRPPIFDSGAVLDGR